MAPRTRKASKTAMTKKPKMANNAWCEVRLPMPTWVAGLPTTMPLLIMATRPRNNPIPAAMAERKDLGIPAIIQLRAPVAVNSTKITPEIKTAPKACCQVKPKAPTTRSEEHTSELQSRGHLVCRLLLEKKKK